MGEISVLFAVEAEQLLLTEMYDEAIDLCYEGLKLYPEYASAYSIISRALVKLNKKDDALNNINNAIKLFPSNKLLKSVKDEIESFQVIEDDPFGEPTPKVIEEDIFSISTNSANINPESDILIDRNNMTEGYSANPDSTDLADSSTNNEHSFDIDSIFSADNSATNTIDNIETVDETEPMNLDDIDSIFSADNSTANPETIDNIEIVDETETMNLDDIDSIFSTDNSATNNEIIDNIETVDETETMNLDDIDSFFSADNSATNPEIIENIQTVDNIETVDETETMNLDDIDSIFSADNSATNTVTIDNIEIVDETESMNLNDIDNLFDNDSKSDIINTIETDFNTNDFENEIIPPTTNTINYESDGMLEYTVISADEVQENEIAQDEIGSGDISSESGLEPIDNSISIAIEDDEFTDQNNNNSDYIESIDNNNTIAIDEVDITDQNNKEIEELSDVSDFELTSDIDKPIIEGHISSEELLSSLTAKLSAVNAERMALAETELPEEIKFEKYNFAESAYEEELGEITEEFLANDINSEAEDVEETMPAHLMQYVGLKGFVNRFSYADDLFDKRIKSRKLDLIPGLDNSPIRDRRQLSKRIFHYQCLPQEPDFCVQNDIVKEQFEDFSSLFGFKSQISDEIIPPELTVSAEPKREIITETIANIYVLQGAYSEAIKAYTELARLYPDKKDYFEKKNQEAQAKEEAIIKD